MNKRRIWIQDFRIYDTAAGRAVYEMLKQWRASRQRPTHFVRAMLIYKALVEGDIACFYDLLLEAAPHTAVKLMRGGTIPSSDQRIEEPAPRPVLRIMETEASEAVKIDALAESLGLDELEFS